MSSTDDALHTAVEALLALDVPSRVGPPLTTDVCTFKFHYSGAHISFYVTGSSPEAGCYSFKAAGFGHDHKTYAFGLIRATGAIELSQFGPLVSTSTADLQLAVKGALTQVPADFLHRCDAFTVTQVAAQRRRELIQALTEMRSVARADRQAGLQVAAYGLPADQRLVAGALIAAGFDGTAAQLAAATLTSLAPAATTTATA